ncbi:hypothetical protein [Wolbachia endosymbiont of Drosophila sechellia]|uniref:hypothetical protein n=1 Tax=Wolbachia endosymbiont of Drosophila sechellia TaxID=375925 RepID=UPI001CA39A4E|nr:hypothetical protein [Wolbachia endosymbiont of Drosophila sechellia]
MPRHWFLSKRVSSQCPDTGIQESLLVDKQTSTESGYNIFDEIAERLDSSAKHWNDSSPTSYRDSFAVSLDPANKQRDDELIVTPPRTVIPPRR